ncbi:RNA 2'-phosphotransferase [Spongiimicrobium salis]|uniref:RNA 2'-phosphotransferase n=1 Tax=Spongiimicrobium salis TaxID=1667022 RepID=UPI00374D877C
MTDKKIKQTSKFLSLVLRHKPQILDLVLDENGWANVAVLLERMERESKTITFEQLQFVVANNDKKRFAFNEDKTLIRASQGHSISINLDYKPLEPPQFLYHGTPIKFVNPIKEKGLKKMKRHHVHLSVDRETATKVGARRGKPVILSIRALDMYYAGHQFFISENGVWLTEAVPPQFIEFKK